MKDLSPLLDHRDLAAILKVKPGTIFSWMSRGVPLPPSIKIGGTTRWNPETVKKWFEQREKEKRKRNFED